LQSIRGVLSGTPPDLIRASQVFRCLSALEESIDQPLSASDIEAVTESAGSIVRRSSVRKTIGDFPALVHRTSGEGNTVLYSLTTAGHAYLTIVGIRMVIGPDNGQGVRPRLPD
jgi:hypothetical protein